jgi:hypothetical protein
MILYNLENLHLREIKALRKSLDYIPITGIDAAFIAILQNKIDIQVKQIEDFLRSEEETKQSELQEAIQNDPEVQTKNRRNNKN